MTGLNEAQDISIKVVSCREVVQEQILRNDLSATSGTILGETLACALMMGAGYKNDETLQINIVGTGGVKSVVVLTDGELKVRGMIGNPSFSSSSPLFKTSDVFGGDTGQVQIVRNHPSWKTPQVGIVQLRDVSIALNLALYMSESEQRSSYLLTDVMVEGNLCRHALAICIERLPGATEENIEKSIKNVELVEKKGLRSYLERSSEERAADVGEFRDFAPVLDKILDDLAQGMSAELRWTKAPKFRCSCGIEKVWRTLRLLPREEVQAIVDDPINTSGVSISCEFCGEKYSLTPAEISDALLKAQ